jgi:hypothetical protein
MTPIPGMRQKRNCLASMVHPILQSDLKTDKPDGFFVSKSEIKPRLARRSRRSGLLLAGLTDRLGLLKEPFPEAASASISGDAPLDHHFRRIHV